ncbi:hypothetical protein ABZ370_32720 [Streptomyces sp. NPDC005962]|uniref:hypothetical protein n=1 Tax=Streptomyces sp. NPDC005962 TaxID=3154466 RepID=UPI0033DBE758
MLRRTASGAALVLVSLLTPALASCGSPQTAADRETRYTRVIEDETPRARDVIDVAGAPYKALRSDDGSMLLRYNATSVEDDEGPAANAWRLYGPDGGIVAEHAEHMVAEDETDDPGPFYAVPDGFVFLPSVKDGFFLDVRGERHAVRSSKKPLAFGRGDVLVDGRKKLLRTSTHTVAPATGVPTTRDLTFTDFDERGTAWGVRQPEGSEPYRVTRREDGRPQRSQELPDRLLGEDIDAHGGTAAVPLEKPIGRDDTLFSGLFVTTDDGKSWRTLRNSDQLPLNEFKPGLSEIEVRVLDDGRVLVEGDDATPLVADTPANRSFHKITEPADLTSVFPLGNTLYGIADSGIPSYDHIDGEGLWRSQDGGRSWNRFPGKGD